MAKLGEVTKANIPGVGKVNLFNPVALVQLFLGGVVLLVLWPLAQRAAGKVSSKIPVKQTVSADSPGYVILGQ